MGSAQPPCAGPAQVGDSLGHYPHRGAITNHRMVEGRDGGVRFTSRDRQHGTGLETMPLDAHPLRHRFLLHVFPQGLIRLRPSGCWANRGKDRAVRHGRQRCGQTPAPPRPQPKPGAPWISHLHGRALTRCPQGGAGPVQRTPLAPQATRQRPRSPPDRERTSRGLPSCPPYRPTPAAGVPYDGRPYRTRVSRHALDTTHPRGPPAPHELSLWPASRVAGQRPSSGCQ